MSILEDIKVAVVYLVLLIALLIAIVLLPLIKMAEVVGNSFIGVSHWLERRLDSLDFFEDEWEG